ncbi:Uncharacterised protein [Mycobacteroides abscessus]|uniref:Uncharacterized protein n=1 Tax=Mycobacterium phage phiT46-1 TaxID=2775045 RepID=A0A7T1X3C0_9CAUD|nr:hypothetical protein KDJ10_gp71 [Mycobacterium phage phiT46-1]QSM03162.1 hypothetical protein PROPHIGD24-2_36 [Mycobacterium phage prophiGD24-2]QSM03496.1 hypothetical protein PROPHIGD21-3_36 [Mycobacterium phage prophiGD21-3]QSM04093.1 hypothetical protein PROPHIGD03_1_41 [Mycobacterium phage prophiGD03-1]WJJ56744.1 hypothetical protein PROPHIT461_36 [Mycobacterium phage prophiT46-1]CPR57467.1 Uncharacterised protein [Mycobacteroides abscessus]SHU56635.1 Uncharacterised protein [Mycobacte
MTDNPICVCGHRRSDHDIQANPKCLQQDVDWPWRCDCPGFEADPKAINL